jgi:hypothetical protein
VITRWLVPLLMAVLLAGCTSPEATRSRGHGAGADVGNHPTGALEMHGGADMYAGTPRRSVPGAASVGGDVR